MLVLALFWMENILIGALNLLKIVAASIVQKDRSGLFNGPFFFVHYGLFCSVHGILLAKLLGYSNIDSAQVFNIDRDRIDPLFLDGAAVFVTFIQDLSPLIWVGMTALLLSKLSSFIENFILRGEIFEVRSRKLMSQPYSQIIVMHAGILIGAVALQKTGSPVWLLAVIVGLKTAVDYAQFQRRHRVEAIFNGSSKSEQRKDN